ncbi:hypothetical protein [Algibacillus agarilyticus]|uniref:hypothetical protein n=1 Tax=Algibacillus agarilyticus TaxID=2234133 RepID=UPI000DD0DFAF|nr:hypothetical protein [Algibacillus agarilyticus]
MINQIKTRYWLIALAALFAVLTYFSFYFWWQDNQQQLTNGINDAQKQGELFGKNNTQLACLERVIKDSEPCRELACSNAHKEFLSACFAYAQHSTEICDHTPETSDYFSTVSWSVSNCKKRKIRNGSCPNIIKIVPALCELKNAEQ